jgi:O-antigen/teichoic acid export membrane protein
MSGARVDQPQVSVKPGRMHDVRLTAMLVRFGFGAGVSAVAGVVSLVYGAQAGGVFLAFPAILLASLSLVAKKQNLRAARDDARGAAIGSVGMVAFAIVCAVLAHTEGGIVALGAATVAWVLVSFGWYLLVRRLGHGADEPEPGASSDRSSSTRKS